MSSAVEIDKALRDAGAYNTPRLTKGDGYNLGGLGSAQVVDSAVDSTSDTSWSYDESYEAWAVFEVEGRLFRKTGYGDSWDAFGWDGALIEVSAETVEKIEYKPKEVSPLTGEAIEAWVEEEADEGWYELYDSTTPWGDLKVIETSEWGEGNTGPIYHIFTLGGKTWKKTGDYQSWVGTEWDGPPFEVTAKPVTKIEYVRL